MRAYVAVTDPNWFRFLRSRPDIDEVNFWRPGSDRHFRALKAGEPFLFKLPSPQNFIVGGGLFARFYALPVSLDEPYFPFDGTEISLPSRPEEQPSKRFLEWHADTVFRG